MIVITPLIKMLGELCVMALVGLGMACIAYWGLEQDNKELEAGKEFWSGFCPDSPEHSPLPINHYLHPNQQQR